MTPLMFASQNGQLDGIKYLIRLGASVLEVDEVVIAMHSNGI